MKIEWNKVTWYSKLAAIIIFVGTFWLAFYLGREYQSVIQTNPQTSSLLSPWNYQK